MDIAAKTGRLIRLPSRSAGWRTDPQTMEMVPTAAGAGRMIKDTLRVLLVEDEPGDARLVEYALRMSSSPVFVVKHVGTLAAAIAHVESGETVDVVLLDLSLPDSTGIATVSRMQEAASKTPIVIMTGMDDPRFAAYALEVGAQDYLIKSDDPERTVGRAIRYAITRMAGQLERQALIERIAEQQRHLVEEVNAARAMQFDLLPRPERVDERLSTLGVEVESFFEPSSGIGGDLWGCLDCGGPRMSFYCFDFTGHGIGAALNVFRLHALISDHWDPRRSPGEMLSTLSGALRGLLGRGQFATMFLCTVDTEADEIEWASAGAPAPVIMNRGDFRFLDARGIPLGLSKAPTYADSRDAFPPGASLLMYSDAITDAPLDGEQLFGEAGLSDAVRSLLDRDGDLRVEHLLEEVGGKVQMPFEDDLTAVCIRRLRNSHARDGKVHARPAGENRPRLTVRLPPSEQLTAQCGMLGVDLVHRPPGSEIEPGTVLLGDAEADLVRDGLMPPYSGFVELGEEGVVGMGLRCLETVRQGGICLSLRTSSVYRLETLDLVAQALIRRLPDLSAETTDLMGISLGEALSNAVIHGNLGIPNHLRTTPEGFAQFQRKLHAGLADPCRAGRRIEINVHPRGSDFVVVAVSDQGGGFDLTSKLQVIAHATAKSGRGLGLIRRAAHSLHSEDGGRTLVMTFAR